MNISFDQNKITIEGNIYEAVKEDSGFCNGCELDCNSFNCCDFPCKRKDRLDRENVIFKKKSDNNNLK